MCLLLLAAGHETTANLIGNGTLALLQHPDQLDWLAQHPDLTPQAIEELLRYDSPAQVASRVARYDLVLGGVRVREGAAGDRRARCGEPRPARYPDPDRLDLARTGAPHLAFGNGPHFCVGAGLARLEAQETFMRLSQSPLRPRAGCSSHIRDDSPTFRRLQTLRIEDKHLEPAPRPEPGRPPRATRPGPREAGRFSKSTLRASARDGRSTGALARRPHKASPSRSRAMRRS